MTEQGLSDQRIRELFQEFDQVELPSDYGPWRSQSAAVIDKVRAMSDAELLTPQGQETIWRARGISGIGPGEAVNVTEAYSDPEIAEALVDIRRRDWGNTPEQCAVALQAHFDRLIELVKERHSKKAPFAKLARAFTVLIPERLGTCFSWTSLQASQRIVLGRQRMSFIEGAYLVADRVRQALETPNASLALARQHQFIWWLSKNEEAVSKGETPRPAPDPSEEPSLELWSATKQTKGVVAVAGYHEAFRAVIRAAQGGASTDDIVESLEQDLEDRSPKSRRSVFNSVRRFGFLVHRDGLWYASETGDELIEFDPPDVLVRLLLIRNFGPAHILRFLKSKSAMRKEVMKHLRSLYPNWTVDFAPGATLAWCLALGLVETVDDGPYKLTTYGEYWEARLPHAIPVPENTVLPISRPTTHPPSGALASRGFHEVWNRLLSDDASRGLVLSEQQVRTLHTAWHFHPTKRFAILSGLSGAGKTRLLVEYARVYCELSEADVETNVAVVPVSPDWRDPTGLLGYFNALHAVPTFQMEPALELLIEANRSPAEPFFLILDEMNLARVERYFAPFLSAMETGGAITLHSEEDAVNQVPQRIPWPKNLFIGGTVNMDETTHAFSDKVLDRAFTLEFWEVDLPSLFERRHAAGKKDSQGENLLLSAFEALRPIRRHFGYRTATELLDFVESGSTNAPPIVRTKMLDQALFSKVLPRIRGEESPTMQAALDTLLKIAEDGGLEVSHQKLKEMRERLTMTGLTRFWT